MVVGGEGGGGRGRKLMLEESTGKESLQNLDLHRLASLWTSSFGKKIRQFSLLES